MCETKIIGIIEKEIRKEAFANHMGISLTELAPGYALAEQRQKTTIIGRKTRKFLKMIQLNHPRLEGKGFEIAGRLNST